MKLLDLSQTIGDSVTFHPELVPVYMKYGVDFCCGGDRTVKEAITKDSTDTEQLIQDAEKALSEPRQAGRSGEKNLSELTSEQLINRIVSRHHSYLKQELPLLSELMFKVLAVHGEAHAELFALHKLFGNLKTELEGHLVKEEALLFPQLQKDGSGIASLIEELESEHDAAGDALHKLMELTNHFALPENACASFELLYDRLKSLVADMYMHVHAENNVLFKKYV